MLAGVDIQPFFQQAMSVSDLVGQLRAPEAPGHMMGYGQGDVAMSDSTANGNINQTLNVNLHTLGLDPNALTMLAQQLGQLGPSSMAPAVFPGYGVGDPNAYAPPQPQQSWAGYSDEHDGYGDYEERDRNRDRDGPRGRGWRGRGRGGLRGRGGGEFRSRRPCTFYAQGRRASSSFYIFSIAVHLVCKNNFICEQKTNTHRVTDVDMAMRVTSVTINHPRRIQVISVLKRSAVSRSNQWAAKFWSLLTRGELCIPALNLVLLLGPSLWVLTYFFSFFLLLRYPLSFGTNPSIITASLYHT